MSNTVQPSPPTGDGSVQAAPVAQQKRGDGGQTFLEHREPRADRALIMLFVLMSVLAPGKFLRPVNVMNIALAISVTGLVAMAETVVMISGGLDVSVSAIVGLASVVAALGRPRHR